MSGSRPTCWLGRHTSRKNVLYKGIGPAGCKIRELRANRPTESQGSRARSSSSSHSRGSRGSGGDGGGGSGGNGGGPAPSKSHSAPAQSGSAKSGSKRSSAARRSQSATSKRSDGGPSPQAQAAVSSQRSDGAAAASSVSSRHVRRNQNVRLTEKGKRNREVAAAKAAATKAKQRTEHMKELAVHRAELLKEKKARGAIAAGIRKAERREKDVQLSNDMKILDAYAKEVGGTVAHDYVRLPDKTIVSLKDIKARQGKSKPVKKRIETKAQREARLKKK